MFKNNSGQKEKTLADCREGMRAPISMAAREENDIIKNRKYGGMKICLSE